mgnify:CR=1 FL=1
MMCRQTDYSPISREGLESGFASSVTVSFKRMNSLVPGCLTKALFTFTSMRFIGINYNPLNQLIVDPYHHTSEQLWLFVFSVVTENEICTALTLALFSVIGKIVFKNSVLKNVGEIISKTLIEL